MTAAVYEARIRSLLRGHPRGMTVRELGQSIVGDKLNERRLASIRNALAKRMPDVYVAGWVDPVRGQYQALYRAVTPPANALYPVRRVGRVDVRPETRWVTRDGRAPTPGPLP